MKKPHTSFNQRLSHWIMSHPWLKLIAFILAVVVWLYVKGELHT